MNRFEIRMESELRKKKKEKKKKEADQIAFIS
jgi:hypothetical protein